MRLSRASSRSRLLLVPVGACRSETARGSQSRQILLAEALIGQVTQMRPVKLHPWTSLACLESVLVDATHLRGMRRILVLPWHLHQTTDELVACASHALQRAGADLAAMTSSTLRRPEIIVHGISPAGPLGGLLPPQPRLDRLVERWPGWSQGYTMLQIERVSMLVQQPALPHLTSASVLATDMAYCCFKRGEKDRPGPAESPHASLRGMEFEKVEKAEVR